LFVGAPGPGGVGKKKMKGEKRKWPTRNLHLLLGGISNVAPGTRWQKRGGEKKEKGRRRAGRKVNSFSLESAPAREEMGEWRGEKKKREEKSARSLYLPAH